MATWRWAILPGRWLSWIRIAAVSSSALPAPPDTERPAGTTGSSRCSWRWRLRTGRRGGVGAAVGSVHRVNGGAPEIMIVSQRFTYPTVNVAAAILLALAAVGAGVITIALRAS